MIFRKKILVVFAALTGLVYAQEEQKEKISFPMVGTGFGIIQPMGYLSARFGTFMQAGFDVSMLIRSRFITGLDFKYAFTSNVKEDVLAPIKTSEGFVINNEGNPADIRISGRMWYLVSDFSFLIPWGAVNNRSGILAGIGAGYVEHRIKFLDYAQIVAALDHSMYKGYDRLSGGIIIRENLGYQFISNNRLTNVKLVLSLSQMMTKNYRGFNYDTGKPDNDLKFNLCFHATLVWILPLYKKTAEGIYYTD